MVLGGAVKNTEVVLSITWVSALILASVLTACSANPGNDIVYYEETKILTEEEAENIEEVTENRTRIVFKENTPFVADIEPGDVLVCEYAVPGAEYGFLERVTGLSAMGYGSADGATGLANGGTVVEIEPATLEDAIKQGVISVNQTIPIEDLLSAATWATGVDILEVSGGWNFTYSPVEGVTIEGYLRFTADPVVHIEPSFFNKLKEFEIVLSASLEMEFTVMVESADLVWHSGLYTIGTIQVPPIHILGPVTIIPEIALVVGVGGSVMDGSLEATVTYDRGYDIGLSYIRSRTPQLQTIHEIRGDGANLEEPSISGSFCADVSGGVDLSGTAGISRFPVASLGLAVIGTVAACGGAPFPDTWEYSLDLHAQLSAFADMALLRIAGMDRWDSEPYDSPRCNLAYGASGLVMRRVLVDPPDMYEWWPFPGVEISFSGGHSSVITDGDGRWRKHLLKGEVVVTPLEAGYTFDPPSITITRGSSHHEFWAYPLS
jgi:hypothetical protein